jgi:hypothetical protein
MFGVQILNLASDMLIVNVWGPNSQFGLRYVNCQCLGSKFTIWLQICKFLMFGVQILNLALDM